MTTTHLTIAKVLFENRRDAGRKLAGKLSDYMGKSALVLAIPNGGVPVGLEVARALKADFDVIICRKIAIPFNPEAGLGAIADDGTVFINEELVRRLNLTGSQINYEASRVKEEIKRRSKLYRGERPLPLVMNKGVIIVDDGLASGFTMTAAVESIKRRRPREVIAAVPVGSVTAVEQVSRIADRLVTVAVGVMPRFAIADFYRSWHDLSADEVVRLLEGWRAQNVM